MEYDKTKCDGGFGHYQKDYWKSKKTVSSEAFADFFSAYARNNEEEILYLREAFPSAFIIFEDMLKWMW